MNARTALRVLTLVPAVFAAIGARNVYLAFAFRRFIPPTPALVVGLIVIASALLAGQQLWTGRRFAAWMVAVSGTCALACVLATPRLFPLVEGRSERPTFFEQYGYAFTLAFIVTTTISAGVNAHRLTAPDPSLPSA